MRLQLGFEATARVRESSVRAVWLPLALHLRLASESSACTQHTTTLHGTAFLVIDCHTDALSNVDASERRWLTDCNTSGAWGSGHTGPARLRTRSAIAMIASGRIGHACTARGDGGDTAIATDTALASHCYHVMPRLHRGTALVQVRPAKAERTANTTVHQWQRFRSIAVATAAGVDGGDTAIAIGQALADALSMQANGEAHCL